MQQITIIGNLAKDPEMRTTQAGIQVCSFTVAVSRRKREDTDFFQCSAWRGLADACFKYLQKGKKVYVSGELQPKTYTGKDGETRMSLNLVADAVEFLSPKQDGVQPSEHVPEDFEQLGDEELPF